MNKVAAIVPAAGRGKRIRLSLDKPYISLKKKTILEHTLSILSSSSLISEIVLAVSKNKLSCAEKIANKMNFKHIKVVEGGKERIDSVYNALKHISSDIDYVLIHDSARPLVTSGLIERSLKAGFRYGASVAAVPVKPTIKNVDKKGRIRSTPDRRNLWEAQTPQVFKKSLLEKAYKHINKKANITDDSMLVEYLGIKPKIVLGSYSNIKITTKEDLEIARVLLAK